jgi:2-isopropylmalate synthase
LLSRITGIQVQRNKAIVGLNAFAHESGIHQHGMLKNRGTYEIMRPQDVGWEDSQLVLGRHSGRAAVANRLRALGYVLEDAQLDQVIAEAKALTHTQHVITDSDLQRLVEGEHVGPGWRIAGMGLSDNAGTTHARVDLSIPMAATWCRAPMATARSRRCSPRWRMPPRSTSCWKATKCTAWASATMHAARPT